MEEEGQRAKEARGGVCICERGGFDGDLTFQDYQFDMIRNFTRLKAGKEYFSIKRLILKEKNIVGKSESWAEVSKS